MVPKRYSVLRPVSVVAGPVLLVLAMSGLAVIATLILIRPSAAAAPAKPHTAASYYIYTTSSTAIYDYGCDQGTYDATHGDLDSLVILDFGRQEASGGVIDPGGESVPYATVESLATDFASGYYYCTDTDVTSLLTLAVGTNTSYVGSYSSSSLGLAWAEVTNEVVSQTSSYSAQVTVWGANDMEQGYPWASGGWASDWVTNYQGDTDSKYLNYGTSICGTTSYVDHDCGFGAPFSWSLSQIYDVSFGYQLAEAAPEMYVAPPPSQPYSAERWTMASLYGHYYGTYGAIYFEGPLDTWPLANSTNTSAESWQQLTSEIEQYSELYGTDDMLFSLEMNNATN